MLLPTTEVVILFITGLAFSTAIKCYSCNYTRTDYQETSTCKEPLNSASGNETCNGLLCSTKWVQYSSPGSNARVHACSDNQTEVPPIDDCQGKTMNNKSYYVYQHQCCHSTGESMYGTVYNITECYCQTDYCNAVSTSPASNGTTPMNNSSVTVQSMNYSTTGGLNPGLETTTTTTTRVHPGPSNKGTNVAQSVIYWATVHSVAYLLLYRRDE